MARNWKELGLAWEAATVQKQHGDHATDRKPVNVEAQIPKVTDIDLAKAAGVDILGWVNSSNSPRVMAQEVARGMEGEKDVEKIREKVFARLLGVRNSTGRTVTVTIVKRPLADGTLYEGNDQIEYRAAYMASLVDQGVDSNTARTIAQSLPW